MTSNASNQETVVSGLAALNNEVGFSSVVRTLTHSSTLEATGSTRSLACPLFVSRARHAPTDSLRHVRVLVVRLHLSGTTAADHVEEHGQKAGRDVPRGGVDLLLSLGHRRAWGSRIGQERPVSRQRRAKSRIYHGPGRHVCGLDQ